jgi:hypothetical protein
VNSPPPKPEVILTNFFHHFDICDKRDHTTDIDPFLFGKKFDISISGKYAEQNEQVFTDVLCHVHYNALDNLKKESSKLYLCEHVFMY